MKKEGKDKNVNKSVGIKNSNKKKTSTDIVTNNEKSNVSIVYPNINVTFKYRLVKYNVRSNNKGVFLVYQIIPTEKFYEFSKGLGHNDLISILKQNKILSDKANIENIKIDGEHETILIFSDSEKGMPLFELRNEDYEKKSDGGNLAGSELLSSEVSSFTEEESLEKEGSIKDEENTLDYDSSLETVLMQHVNPNTREILVLHVEQILQKPSLTLKYEEIIGSVILRKCFLRPYYKLVNKIS